MFMFIHNLYFSESQFGPFPSCSAPKWSSFKIKREEEMWRKLGGGCGRGLGNEGLISSPPLHLGHFPVSRGCIPCSLLFQICFWGLDIFLPTDKILARISFTALSCYFGRSMFRAGEWKPVLFTGSTAWGLAPCYQPSPKGSSMADTGWTLCPSFSKVNEEGLDHMIPKHR